MDPIIRICKNIPGQRPGSNFRRLRHIPIESCRRQPDQQWLLTESTGLESTLRLHAIDCELALTEVYGKVELQNEADG